MSIAVAQVSLTSLATDMSPTLRVRWTMSFELTAAIISTGKPILLATNPPKKQSGVLEFLKFRALFPNVNKADRPKNVNEVLNLQAMFPAAPVGTIIRTFSDFLRA